ncbi:hypothetical protein DFJ73DRAFT_904193 [Zopfochytrium polystomum]|nr:hypothetical protein DFJ73DRAFT_904193 [Zopfochytrium polystomum]
MQHLSEAGSRQLPSRLLRPSDWQNQQVAPTPQLRGAPSQRPLHWEIPLRRKLDLERDTFLQLGMGNAVPAAQNRANGQVLEPWERIAMRWITENKLSGDCLGQMRELALHGTEKSKTLDPGTLVGKFSEYQAKQLQRSGLRREGTQGNPQPSESSGTGADVNQPPWETIEDSRQKPPRITASVAGKPPSHLGLVTGKNGLESVPRHVVAVPQFHPGIFLVLLVLNLRTTPTSHPHFGDFGACLRHQRTRLNPCPPINLEKGTKNVSAAAAAAAANTASSKYSPRLLSSERASQPTAAFQRDRRNNYDHDDNENDDARRPSARSPTTITIINVSKSASASAANAVTRRHWSASRRSLSLRWTRKHLIRPGVDRKLLVKVVFSNFRTQDVTPWPTHQRQRLSSNCACNSVLEDSTQ